MSFYNVANIRAGFVEALKQVYVVVFRFLEQNQNQFEKNYFEIVMSAFNEQFIPYLTGEKVGSENARINIICR